ncbi:MAG TPA: apolipoprotein N-acyltransferase [Pyrinomonadaceae bacterium]|nr:apolipoprotein N-acyltransferase [Pyrinomonadaceae bacterium]
MKLASVRQRLPDWKNALLALASAVLLILAFPDFEYWPLAWIALVPLMWAVERVKDSAAKAFVLGWIFGTAFFFGTCWWLTFAPITYAGFPAILAYGLFFFVAAAAGIFPALFAAVLAKLLNRFGSIAILAAPFIWVFTEFLRYWVTGNNWNALGYSQAFVIPAGVSSLHLANIGGIYLTSFSNASSSVLAYLAMDWIVPSVISRTPFEYKYELPLKISFWFVTVSVFALILTAPRAQSTNVMPKTKIIAIQPNVPMSGLTYAKWQELRQRHVQLAETALAKLNEQRATNNEQPTTVIFPESPMNFEYETDPETRRFIDSFASRHNVSVLFNSAEPDATNGKVFNSAVMVSPAGREVAQYDKIYLLPFGEAVPFPLEGLLPGFVGNFSYGREYDLLPLGDAKAGVMICFESHFGQLSRRYVADGADVIIEMTNDGYLGPTPVLRQHLASAVFRAVETNRPVLRVTNVGLTAYINEKGAVLDAAPVYQEDTRIWSVSKSDGSQTFYVRYGDWFAWLCSAVTLVLLILSFSRREISVLSANSA